MIMIVTSKRKSGPVEEERHTSEVGIAVMPLADYR